MEDYLHPPSYSQVNYNWWVWLVLLWLESAMVQCRQVKKYTGFSILWESSLFLLQVSVQVDGADLSACLCLFKNPLTSSSQCFRLPHLNHQRVLVLSQPFGELLFILLQLSLSGAHSGQHRFKNLRCSDMTFVLYVLYVILLDSIHDFSPILGHLGEGRSWNHCGASMHQNFCS